MKLAFFDTKLTMFPDLTAMPFLPELRSSTLNPI